MASIASVTPESHIGQVFPEVKPTAAAAAPAAASSAAVPSPVPGPTILVESGTPPAIEDGSFDWIQLGGMLALLLITGALVLRIVRGQLFDPPRPGPALSKTMQRHAYRSVDDSVQHLDLAPEEVSASAPQSISASCQLPPPRTVGQQQVIDSIFDDMEKDFITLT
eukprot:TRINITY_DN43607_c0_g1_i1.p1 TRINITY_DN43607_c0_g1~~TRINITY_DN43607_c0_g1_i1.p1  ORF type:complete len:166 (+),score=36.15 TRINITY_DN43607_c0_g1_i1:86-583(+)